MEQSLPLCLFAHPQPSGMSSHLLWKLPQSRTLCLDRQNQHKLELTYLHSPSVSHCNSSWQFLQPDLSKSNPSNQAEAIRTELHCPSKSCCPQDPGADPARDSGSSEPRLKTVSKDWGLCHPQAPLAWTGCVIRSFLSTILLSLRINKQELLRSSPRSKLPLSATSTHPNALVGRAKWHDYEAHLNMLPRKLTYLPWESAAHTAAYSGTNHHKLLSKSGLYTHSVFPFF